MTQDLRANAPYRFVPLSGHVVETEHKDHLDTLHDTPLEGGLSATLDVEWAAETPFLIGEESPNDPEEFGPMKLGDVYVIPGASLRGMLRSVMEIACFARLRQINDHHRYAIRDFQHPYYKASLLQQSEVKSGWMRKVDKQWMLRPCEWKPVTIDSILNERNMPGREAWLKSDRFSKFDHLGAATCSEDGFTVDWQKTLRPVRPGEKNRLEVGHSDEHRYIVPSGAAVNTSGRFAKKVEYAFTAGDAADDTEIDPKAWRGFLTVHSKPSRNKQEPAGAWAEWTKHAKDGLWIPVFYIGTPGQPDQAIGLTRLFRLPAMHSVGNIRDKVPSHRLDGRQAPDMVEALFGYVHEDKEYGDGPQDEALRGRIRFGFARLADGQHPQETPPMTAVMMGPRASFAPFYLIRDHDWSGDPFLAGRKRYPVRFAQDRRNALNDIRARFRRSTSVKEGKTDDSNSTQSKLRLLHAEGEDLVFKGQIRLHNVSPVELGAVIWALKLGETGTKTRRHALGRGKAFGCGQMRVKSIGLRVHPHDPGHPQWEELLLSARTSDRPAEGEHWMPPKPLDAPDWHSLSPFASVFSAFMARNVTDWGKSASIQTLLASANPVRGEQLRRQDKLNYLGEKDNDQKDEDGHTAHSKLKRDVSRTGAVIKLPWA